MTLEKEKLLIPLTLVKHLPEEQLDAAACVQLKEHHHPSSILPKDAVEVLDFYNLSPVVYDEYPIIKR